MCQVGMPLEAEAGCPGTAETAPSGGGSRTLPVTTAPVSSASRPPC